jgi:hypothetical protein
MTPLIVFAPDGEQPASLPAPKPYRKHFDTLRVSSHRSIPQSRLMTIDSGRITGNSDVTRLGTAQSFVRHFRVTSAHTIFVFGASDQLLRFRELGSGEVKAQPLLKLLANFRRSEPPS